MNKRKILYISMSIPYEQIRHAGGKTFHYYINSFAEDVNNEVTLIAKVLPEEENQIININPKIRTLFVRTPKNKINKYFSYIKSINSKFNPLYPYGNVLTKEIYDQIEICMDKLKKSSYQPDIVILEWTWMLLFIQKVKKRFPNAKYVSSEHDVSFLGIQRKMNNSKGIKKIIKKLYYCNIKNRELQCIKMCDYVVTHNKKDKKLLLENGIQETKIGVIAPYFEQPRPISIYHSNRDIVYYGAMNRYENEISVLWFIKNVMQRINDLNVRYVIIGNKPSEKLKKYASDKIIITGYVENITPYFSKALCMAAPIQAGAGVKVKILETMALGIPILTNSIGIEGIDAKDGIHYLHCETPKEYDITIRKILSGDIDIEKIVVSAQKLIKENYNLEKSFIDYSNMVYSL